jgi:RimJ/RimL family protein N-acetyltransferase
MTQIPILEAERVRIRPLTRGDLEPCCRLYEEIGWSDATVDVETNDALRASWLDWTVDSYRELDRLDQPPYGERAVESLAGDAFLGLVGLVPSLAAFAQLPGQGARPDWRTRPEVGLFWAFRPANQGAGLATEAAARLAAWAFAELQLERLVATTEHENLRSIAVMRRLGMAIEINAHPESAWPQVVGVLENPDAG